VPVYERDQHTEKEKGTVRNLVSCGSWHLWCGCACARQSSTGDRLWEPPEIIISLAIRVCSNSPCHICMVYSVAISEFVTHMFSRIIYSFIRLAFPLSPQSVHQVFLAIFEGFSVEWKCSIRIIPTQGSRTGLLEMSRWD